MPETNATHVCINHNNLVKGSIFVSGFLHNVLFQKNICSIYFLFYICCVINYKSPLDNLAIELQSKKLFALSINIVRLFTYIK